MKPVKLKPVSRARCRNAFCKLTVRPLQRLKHQFDDAFQARVLAREDASSGVHLAWLWSSRSSMPPPQNDEDCVDCLSNPLKWITSSCISVELAIPGQCFKTPDLTTSHADLYMKCGFISPFNDANMNVVSITRTYSRFASFDRQDLACLIYISQKMSALFKINEDSPIEF